MRIACLFILPLGFLLSSCAPQAPAKAVATEPVAAGSDKVLIDLVGRISNCIAARRQAPVYSGKELAATQASAVEAPVKVVPLIEDQEPVAE